MRELIQAVGELLDEHWVKFLTAAAFTVLGWYFGKRKERRNWERRSFMDRLHISLNSLSDGTLRLRTLLEKPSEEVFLNKTAVSRLVDLAGKTRPGAPIIPIPKEDRWFYLNAILNEISEQFSWGLIVADNQGPVQKQHYLICLTCEAEGEVRTRKIRAMLIRKDLLLNLPAEIPQFEDSRHAVRWQTLQTLAKTFQQTPSYFQEMEIVIPGCGSATERTSSTPALNPPAPKPVPQGR